MVVGNLNKGDHFQIRKNGRWYTIHEFARTIRFDNTCYSGDLYILAVSNGILYAFDFNKNVLIKKGNLNDTKRM